MKSAEEWEAIFATMTITSNQCVCIVQGPDLARVQADALRHAADLVIADWALGGSDATVRDSVKAIRKLAKQLEGL